jgi:hypothetical protein
MLSKIELSDPGQLQMAGVISQMMAGVQTGNKSSSNVIVFVILIVT